MEEIKVGEFVRTKKGDIYKFLKIDKNKRLLGEYFDDVIYVCSISRKINKEYRIKEYQISKHSFNIIDLIENGDYVELEYYVAKYGKRISRVFEISKIEGWDFIAFENAHCNFTYDLELNKWINGKGYNPKIKSIVTKEQFKAMEYEVK